MTKYSLDILLSQFGTSLLFHVQFSILLPDLHTIFSGGRSGGLVYPSLEEFSTVCCDPQSQRLWHSQQSRSRCFLELSYFFDDTMDVGNLISGSSAFSKTSLNIWKFMVHILLKPGLENFENYFTSMWDECNCVVVWAFFGIAFLWDWNENWPFPVLCPLLCFPNLLAYECSSFTTSSFRIWNSSTGTPSPPLASFIMMFPKAHLTSHSRMSGSRWVITPSWYLGHEDLFCTVLLCILATSS